MTAQHNQVYLQAVHFREQCRGRRTFNQQGACIDAPVAQAQREMLQVIMFLTEFSRYLATHNLAIEVEGRLTGVRDNVYQPDPAREGHRQFDAALQQRRCDRRRLAVVDRHQDIFH